MARLCCLFLLLTSFFAVNSSASVTDFIDFNLPGDLAAKFTDDGSPEVFPNPIAGINGTGCVEVPDGDIYDCYTTNTGYSVAGAGDVYTFSGYFINAWNSGYGGFGFTQSGSNVADSFGAPPVSLGMSFHGGGGMFINNQAQTDVYWAGGDMVMGQWYYMVLRIEAKAAQQYDMNFKIYVANSDGTLGSLKTEHNLTVTNTTIGSLSTLHAYLSVAGNRMQYIDNYKIELAGGSTVIEAGMPVVTTGDISDITTTTASAGGNVTDDNGDPVTARGACWSTSAEPTTAGSHTTDGSGVGVFTSALTGLSSNTEYHVRSYATNGVGTSYGSEKVFSTSALPTYTVTYNGNTSTGGTTPVDGSSPYLSGAEVTVLANTFTKTGYTFAGWNTAADGGGASYAPAATFAMGSSNVTLYAQWTANDYTVTYNGNTNTGGSVPTDGNTYNITATVTVLGNTGSLVKTGYTFVGWNTTAIGSGTSYTGGDTFAISNSNITLYAQWTANNYTVTYNGNTNTGGSVPTDSNPYHITDTVTVLGNTGTLVKSGYTFAGWNTAANGSGTSYSEGDTFVIGSNDVTLYSQWAIIKPSKSKIYLYLPIIWGQTNKMPIYYYDKDHNK
jgi:uncharacterized repeat protein (TIGR02543 family)